MRQTACMLNPAGWDLDVNQGVRAARVPEAVAACRVCPLQTRCAEQAEEEPPCHPCVWGGLVYDGSGGPGQTLREWLVANPLPATVDCPGCAKTVPVTQLHRRHCSRECFYRERQRRRRLAAAQVPKRNLPAAVRKEQVRQLVADGLGAEEIAGRLGLGLKSIQNYRRAVMAA